MGKRLLAIALSGAVMTMAGGMSGDDIKREKPQPPAWDRIEDLNLIPCPKIISVCGAEEFVLSGGEKKAVIVIPDAAGRMIETAAALLADEIKTRSGCAPDIYKNGETPKNEQTSVILFSKEVNPETGKYPIGAQGYSISFPRNDMAVLSANSSQGLLYAVETLTQMIFKNAAGETAVRKTKIIDWPDFKKRAATDIQFKNFAAGKKQVDFFSRYKYNFLVSNGTMKKELWEEIRKVNQYAANRGIKIIYFFNWSTGKCSERKNDPRFKDCVQYNGEYYCWSNDDLIEERLRDLCEFARETDSAFMAFHCVDSYEENWPERCDLCKKRFGDDRAAADAHVINMFTNSLRRINKDIELSFVTQPYGMNLNLPGNLKYKAYYQRLTELIPQEVYLNATGYSRDAAASWTKIVRQPLVRWQNGGTFQIGRFFDSEPCFFKGVYFPEHSGDMAFLNEIVSFFDGDVMALIGAEYMWNTEAPGATFLTDDPDGKLDFHGPYQGRSSKVMGKAVGGGDGSGFSSASFDPVKEPRETCNTLLNRVCRRLYGPAAAAHMADYLRQGVKGWTQTAIAASAVEKGEAADQFKRCSQACEILRNAMANTVEKTENDTLIRFYCRTAPLKLFFELCSQLDAIQTDIADGHIGRAESKLDQCRQTVAQRKTELLAEKFCPPADISKWLTAINERIELAACRIKFSQNKTAEDGSPNAMKIAVYNPESSGGKSYNMTLYNFLKKNSSANTGRIDNLKEETLEKYNVLVIPQIVKFGRDDDKIYKENIRRFVSEKGGGVYFEHDAVGFYRSSATPESIFPEICRGGEKRDETTKVIIAKNHPALGRLKPGEKAEHMYWDHIILSNGPTGTVIVTNPEGKPVVIAGQAGKGRVIFSGMITTGRDDKDKEDAELLDKILLENAVIWLFGKSNLIQNPFFKDVKGDRAIGWSGDYTLIQNASAAGNALQLTLRPRDRYAIISSSVFSPDSGTEYYLELRCKKDGNFRVIPMIVFESDNSKDCKRISLAEFPYRKEIPCFDTFSGIIKSPDNFKIYKEGRFNLFADWFGGNPDSDKSLMIESVKLIKMK
jgi:hypothetical protein